MPVTHRPVAAAAAWTRCTRLYRSKEDNGDAAMRPCLRCATNRLLPHQNSLPWKNS